MEMISWVKGIGLISLAGLAGVHMVTNAQSASAAKDSSKAAGGPEQEVWRFDKTSELGGHPATVLGHPLVIDSPYGKAVQFNGVDDALFVDVHPLAGVSAFTWEVIFRPDADGRPEQRFFHLQEQDKKTRADTENRMLFEIRLVNGQWALDSFATTNGQGLTLLNRGLLHPAGKWYRVEAVYDGKTFSNYVDGELQNSGPLQIGPQLAGHSSVGVRINKVDYFKGAILMARMTRHALKPEEFLKMPQLVADGAGKQTAEIH